MAKIQGFPPISRPDARTLILGSMPSRESLTQRRYYAHPRNGFWPILGSILDLADGDYQQCADGLVENGVAVWDVLKTCFRTGSLDSDIDDHTIVANDFRQFFAAHPDITRVFFNGAKAEAIYMKQILPGLDGAAAELKLQRLPSTSPANAGMSPEQKKAAWRAIE